MKSQAEKRKRTQARKEAARKDSTSIRFSENDKAVIRDKAAGKDMQFSEYVRHMAVHGDEGLSPAKKCSYRTLRMKWLRLRKNQLLKSQRIFKERRKKYGLGDREKRGTGR